MITDRPNFWTDKGKQTNWQEYILPGRTIDEFEKEGFLQARVLSAFIKKDTTIVEYGCGVGRITKHIANFAKRTIGLDISKSYIEKAKRFCSDIDNLDFFTIDNFTEPECADFIYSVMVFQHNSETNRKNIIDHIIRLLRPGGTVLISFPKAESKFYTETKFVHKFTLKEVEYFGSFFSDYKIIEQNLVNYKNNPHPADYHEYFLIATK